jgi:hypothetical protein
VTVRPNRIRSPLDADGNEVTERDRQRKIERWALDVVGAELRVEVESWDSAGRQAAPDGRFERDGRVGFVEVTSIGDPAVRAGEAAYVRFAAWRPGNLSWSFTINMDPTVSSKAFETHIPAVVRMMERNGTKHPHEVTHLLSPGTRSWLQDLLATDRISIDGGAITDSPGTIYVVPAMGDGGMVPTDPDVILPAITDTLAEQHVASRVAKLAATGSDTEQHLFVVVRDDAWPWAPLYMIAVEHTVVPSAPPSTPEHLDGLWFVHFYNRSVLVWTRELGWRWISFDDPTDSDIAAGRRYAVEG